MCFRLGTSPPRGTVGCATFPFRVGFRLFSRSPRHDGSLPEGFDFGFPCLSACVLLQFAFFVSPPHPTLTVRGRSWAVVCLIIALFRLAPPPHAGGTREVFDGGLPYYSVCVSFTYFSSRFSWLHSQAEVWEWVLRSHIFDSWSSSGNRDFPDFPILLHMRLIRVG